MNENGRSSDDEDHALVACLNRFASGDTGARDELIALASERIREIAHRMLRRFPSVRRWDETGDVVQNAMLRLCNALTKVTPSDPRSFIGLAAMQVRRELLDLARKHAGPESYHANHETNVFRVDGEERVKIADAPDAADTPDRLLRWTRLHEVAELLPDEERETFHLAWYMGMKQDAIAAMLGCSTRTVKRRWDSAKTLLAQRLGGEQPD
jgi:RNA polymerase sigma factor (sigma-70 family)